MENLKAEEVKLKLVYGGLAAGQLFLLLLAFLVIKPESEPQLIMRIGIPLVMLGMMILGYQMYMQPIRKLPHLQRIQNENLLDNNAVPLPEKKIESLFVQYRTRALIRWACLEGANLLAIVGYIISGDYLLLFYVFLGLIVFGTASPSVRQFARDYHLTLVEDRALKRD